MTIQQLCECGCGQIVNEGKRFILGHAVRCQSEESRRKQAESMAGKNKGENCSKETRQKLGKAHKDKVITEEQKKKISETLTGKMCGEKNGNYRRVIGNEERKRRSEAKKGDKHPNWKGGISAGPYCPKFNYDFKERVREFFGRKCFVCGTLENGRKLSVHHVNYDKMVCCNDTIPLFVPLCNSCHSKTNGNNREYWEEKFTRELMEQYDGECYLSKEIM